MQNELNVEKLLEAVTRLALDTTKGCRTEAAKLMGVSVRTLRNWINKYDLTHDYPPSHTKGHKSK